MRTAGSRLGRVARLLLVALVASFALAPLPAHAAFPGANGKIAFGPIEPNGGVRVINPDGTGQMTLTPGGLGFQHGAPAWAPGGNRLAFYYSDDDGFTQIETADADGSDPRYVTSADVVGDPAWSPDGAKLVFSTSYAGALFTIGTDGTNRAQLSNGPEDHSPAWSPNGDKIAFDGDFCCVYIMNSDGSGRTLLAQGSNPDWSPDGTKLAFSGCTPTGTPCGLIVMNADGSQARAIDPNGGDPAWSPDGRKIVATLGCCSLYVMNADGSNNVLLTPTYGSDPDWQPLPGPQRSDFKNAAQFCKAKREFMGEGAFGQTYGTGGNGAHAFGKCVSADGLNPVAR
jgi:dipeptidyl aminopeptidase/acylaminoacyl peptidase